MLLTLEVSPILIYNQITELSKASHIPTVNIESKPVNIFILPFRLFEIETTIGNVPAEPFQSYTSKTNISSVSRQFAVFTLTSRLISRPSTNPKMGLFGFLQNVRCCYRILDS